jgi:drug/metabolite transporter (DMT)-like permease
MPQSFSTARPWVAMIIAPILWSSAGVVSRFIERAGRWEIACLRSLFCALSMLLILNVLKPGRVVAEVRKMGRIGFVSSGLWALMFTCFMLALSHIPVANVLILSSLSPLAASLFGVILLRERLTVLNSFCIALALVGATIMVAGDFFATPDNIAKFNVAGTIFALIVPFTAALNWTLIKRSGATVDLAPAIMMGALLSALFCLPFAYPFTATPMDIGLLAGLGFFQLALPCALCVYAARTLSPTIIGLLALLETFFGPIWVWLFVGERPANMALVGGAFVFGALLLQALAPKMQTVKIR